MSMNKVALGMKKKDKKKKKKKWRETYFFFSPPPAVDHLACLSAVLVAFGCTTGCRTRVVVVRLLVMLLSAAGGNRATRLVFAV